jgi:hypothetical protein
MDTLILTRRLVSMGISTFTFVIFCRASKIGNDHCTQKKQVPHPARRRGYGGALPRFSDHLADLAAAGQHRASSSGILHVAMGFIGIPKGVMVAQRSGEAITRIININ